MKDEVSFEGGRRGRFYRPGARLNLPIYLEDEVMAFVQRIAAQKGKSISDVVNELLLYDKSIVDASVDR